MYLVRFRAQCPRFRNGCEKWGLGSTSNYCRPVLLGYGTMAGNLFPHAVLPDESIGTEHSLDAVFAPDHSIISIGIARTGSFILSHPDAHPTLRLAAPYRSPLWVVNSRSSIV